MHQAAEQLTDALNLIVDEAGEDFELAETRLTPEVGRHLMTIGYNTYVQQHRAALRAKLKAAPRQVIPLTPRQAKLIAAMRERVFDHWKIGDKKLGDHTKPELLAAAEQERLKKLGYERNEHFYTRLAALLPDDSTPLRATNAEQKAEDIRAEIYAEHIEKAA